MTQDDLDEGLDAAADAFEGVIVLLRKQIRINRILNERLARLESLAGTEGQK